MGKKNGKLRVWKNTVQRMTRRRLPNSSGKKTRDLVAAIVAQMEVPVDVAAGGSYAIMSWFASRSPILPRSKARSVSAAEWRERSDAFLKSPEWRRLRMRVILKRGNRCECCGATPRDGRTVINVDHIKPRHAFPELALVESNLQVLCEDCNHGKGRWDQTDWRSGSAAAPKPVVEAPVVAAPPPKILPRLIKVPREGALH